MSEPKKEQNTEENYELFYDGECNFCNFCMNFVKNRLVDQDVMKMTEF
jgi:predicted DCC family thiol-disulfide oxidoreductase YuxK